MATIKTAIQIYDRMTRPLQAMSRGLNTLINVMETAQGTFDHGFDPTVLQQIREDIAEATAGFDQMEQQIRQADNAQNRFNDRIQEGSDNAGGLLQQIKNIAVAVGGLTAIKKLVDLSDSMASTKARLALIVDDGGSVADFEKEIMALAQRSRAFYLTTARAISQMGLAAGDAFSNNDELLAFTETLNKQFVIAGTGAQQIEAATLQLTQALASGVLRGDELNSVFENAPLVVQSIADYLGVSIGEIRSMAAEGKLTADVVKNAVLSSADEVNKAVESMPMTWGQVFIMASNIALQALQPLLNGINWLANNISIIGPLVLGLGAPFAVFQIAAHWTQIAAAATAIYHGVVNFLSIGFGILTGNTAAASAAVFTFNSALLANPIVWVVMLIAVLIAALYAGVAAYNKFTNSAVSATGIIGGAFAALGAFILNTFIIPLQNAIAMIVNFIGNIFNDPVAAVKVLFYDMCLTVIGYIRNLAQGIEDLINKIPGVTVDITSGLDSFYAGLEQAQQKVKDEAGWVEYVQKMDFIDYSNAASAGYKFGEGIADKISGAFSLDSTDAFNLGGTFEGIYNNTSETAANTAASADSLNLNNEELEWMRDLAEQEAINRFTTTEIRVDMGGVTQNVASYLDAETLTHRMVEAINNGAAMGVEGVYA